MDCSSYIIPFFIFLQSYTTAIGTTLFILRTFFGLTDDCDWLGSRPRQRGSAYFSLVGTRRIVPYTRLALCVLFTRHYMCWCSQQLHIVSMFTVYYVPVYQVHSTSCTYIQIQSIFSNACVFWMQHCDVFNTRQLVWAFWIFFVRVCDTLLSFFVFRVICCLCPATFSASSVSWLRSEVT